MPSSDVMLSVTRRVFESPKCDKCVGGRADQLGELQRSPDPLAAIWGVGRGHTSKGEGRGETGKGRGRYMEREME